MNRDDWSILSERDRGVQVRWKEAVRENLEKDPTRFEIPKGYKETECGDPALPDGAAVPTPDDP